MFSYIPECSVIYQVNFCAYSVSSVDSQAYQFINMSEVRIKLLLLLLGKG